MVELLASQISKCCDNIVSCRWIVVSDTASVMFDGSYSFLILNFLKQCGITWELVRNTDP